MAQYKSDKNPVKKQVRIDDTNLTVIMIILAAIIVLIITSIIYFTVTGITSSNASNPNLNNENNQGNQGNQNSQVSGDATYPFKQNIDISIPSVSDDTELITDIYSDFAVLLDVTDNKIVASKVSSGEIYPASLTKVMTLIVVFENLRNEDSLNDTITITQEYVDKKVTDQHSGDLSTPGEVLTVKDLIYNLILKSDGIAALALADYIAGSENAFVTMMNDKATEIGLEKTQFSNCSGIHETYHLTTPKDMATIMAYAMKNPFCADVLSAFAHKYSTNTYPDGVTAYHSILVSKLHNDTPSKKITPTTADITAAKSGWAGKESGHCLVTYAVGKNGHKYILVTAKADSSQESIDDMVYIYNEYLK